MSIVAEVKVAVATQSGRVRLTPQENKVIYLISLGYSSQEAADHEKLFVSKRTVDFHLANIYEKLRVSNRVQACRELERLGIMPDESCLG